MRPAVPVRALPPVATALSSQRYASDVPATEPAKRAQSLIDALPGNSLVSKTAILSAGASLSVWAIANEIYVLTEETVTAACTATAFGGIFYYLKPMYVQWAQAHIDKVRNLLYEAKQKHRDAISGRIQNVEELGGVINITKSLFEVSKVLTMVCFSMRPSDLTSYRKLQDLKHKRTNLSKKPRLLLKLNLFSTRGYGTKAKSSRGSRENLRKVSSTRSTRN